MSAEPKYTEREVAERERAAWFAGRSSLAEWLDAHGPEDSNHWDGGGDWHEMAAELYPIVEVDADA